MDRENISNKNGDFVSLNTSGMYDWQFFNGSMPICNIFASNVVTLKVEIHQLKIYFIIYT